MKRRFWLHLIAAAAGLVLVIRLALTIGHAGEFAPEPSPWFKSWVGAAGLLLFTLPISTLVLIRSQTYVEVDGRRRARNAPGSGKALIGLIVQAFSLLLLLVLLLFATDVL